MALVIDNATIIIRDPKREQRPGGGGGRRILPRDTDRVGVAAVADARHFFYIRCWAARAGSDANAAARGARSTYSVGARFSLSRHPVPPSGLRPTSPPPPAMDESVNGDFTTLGPRIDRRPSQDEYDDATPPPPDPSPSRPMVVHYFDVYREYLVGRRRIRRGVPDIGEGW